MTRSVMLGLAAVLVAGSIVQATQTVKKSQSVTATATIQAIDKANRLVTLRDETGAEDTMQVGPAMKRFDELKVGDKVKVTYIESLVLQVRKPGDPVKPGSDVEAHQGRRRIPLRHIVEPADDECRGPGHRSEAAVDYGQDRRPAARSRARSRTPRTSKA